LNRGRALRAFSIRIPGILSSIDPMLEFENLKTTSIPMLEILVKN
jgi:hypothetical protein